MKKQWRTCTLYWGKEGDDLLSKAVCILPEIPGKQGKGKEDQYSGVSLYQNTTSIIWYGKNKATSLSFFDYLTVKIKRFIIITLPHAQEESCCLSVTCVDLCKELNI